MEHFYQNIGEDWFSYPQLYKRIVENSKEGSHFVEVGSWKGRSASFMAVEILNSSKNIKFDCVDTWEGSIEHLDINSPFFLKELIEDKDWLYGEFLKNTSPVREILNPVRMPSLDAVDLYEDSSLDFVFIDASHEYEDVKKDILAWLPKVKIGGILAGHDYYTFGGVTQAVDEIFNASSLEISEHCYIYKKQNLEKILKKYESLSNTPSDINEHLRTLKKYAEECDTIIEMGVRTIVSTWAFLSSSPKSMTSIDLLHPSAYGANLNEVYESVAGTQIEFNFIESDSLLIDIEECDLLFIDTWHDFLQLKKELTRHHSKVKKYIILHDTVSFGYSNEPLDWNYPAKNTTETNLPSGLCPAIDEFLSSNTDWCLFERYANNNGLTILKRKNL